MEQHQPVLLDEVLRVLSPAPKETFADMTAGYGGHSAALLKAVGQNGHGFLFDRDKSAVEHLKHKFASNTNLSIAQASFATVADTNFEAVDMILADLGVSSPQLATPERGFSFQNTGPLDMRMDTTQKLSAASLVNELDSTQLSKILRDYGQVAQASRIAQAIVNARPITTTSELAEVIESKVGRRGRIHPATKVFQALRIAVNEELSQLEQALPYWSTKLKDGGRLAVISFHSGEDRLVKQFFRKLCTDVLDDRGQVKTPAEFQYVTKRAIKGEESDTNPRARSARLRAITKNQK